MSAPGAIVDTSRDPGQWPQPERAQAWPVGSVFTSVVAANPATLLGYGTWAAFASGQVLVGLNGADTDFTPVEKTGGQKNIPSLTHAGTAVANHASHTHSVTSNVVATTAAVQSGVGTTVVTAVTNNAVSSGNESPTLTHTVTQPNDHPSASMSVVQPYIVVYFWKRTA